MVRDNKKVKFLYYQQGELWYETETGFKFPVPINDTQDGKFPAEDKALLYMRYIKRHIKMIEESIKETNWTPPCHVTGTDNPIDFPPVARTCLTEGCNKTTVPFSMWCNDHYPMSDPT